MASLLTETRRDVALLTERCFSIDREMFPADFQRSCDCMAYTEWLCQCETGALVQPEGLAPMVWVQVAIWCMAKIRHPWFNPTLGCGVTWVRAFLFPLVVYHLIKSLSMMRA